jgi:hypothetical protein
MVEKVKEVDLELEEMGEMEAKVKGMVEGVKEMEVGVEEMGEVEVFGKVE